MILFRMNPNPSLLIKIPPSLENSQILTRDNSCLNKPNHGYNRMQMWPRQYECNPWEYEIITKDTMLINLSPQFKIYVQKGIWKVWVSLFSEIYGPFHTEAFFFVGIMAVEEISKSQSRFSFKIWFGNFDLESSFIEWACFW